MTETIKITKCDICGKESKEMHKLVLPVTTYFTSYYYYSDPDDDNNAKEYVMPEQVDFCPECFKELHEVIKTNFANIAKKEEKIKIL